MALNATAAQAHAFLEQQRLLPTPPNYQIAWMHVSGTCAGLTTEIARITDGGVRLRQDEVAELLTRYAGATAPKAAPADARGATATNPAEAELRNALMRIAEIATDTGKASGDFGTELRARLGELDQDPAAVTDVVLSMIERAGATERKLASVRTEVDALRQELEAAKGDAFRDALTDLPNRRAIQKRLAEPGKARAIAICDVDHFKAVNDTFGHQVGDRVLKMVATTIAETCKGHFVGRWGGEEFMVVVEGSEQDAFDVVDQARRAVSAKVLRVRESEKPLGRVTFSAGVSDLRDDAAAIELADRRLYAAKREGRNQVMLSA